MIVIIYIDNPQKEDKNQVAHCQYRNQKDSWSLFSRSKNLSSLRNVAVSYSTYWLFILKSIITNPNMRVSTFLYVASLLCITCEMMICYTLIDEQNLQTILLSGYNSNRRPGMNRSIPLEVSLKLHLFYIKEFRESVSKFAVNGAFVIE